MRPNDINTLRMAMAEYYPGPRDCQDNAYLAMDRILARLAELESITQRVREAAFHPFFSTIEATATIRTILALAEKHPTPEARGETPLPLDVAGI